MKLEVEIAEFAGAAPVVRGGFVCDGACADTGALNNAHIATAAFMNFILFSSSKRPRFRGVQNQHDELGRVPRAVSEFASRGTVSRAANRHDGAGTLDGGRKTRDADRGTANPFWSFAAHLFVPQVGARARVIAAAIEGNRKRMTKQDNEARGAISSEIDAQVKLMKI
jgi:hypothetical protein